MRIKYSPEARDKLCQMKKEEGIKRVSLIMKGIRNLSDYPRQCPTIERVLGIPSSYYFLHIEYTYIFYRVENNTIYITALYSERENFMQKMFGISLRTSESLEFWGE